MSINPDEKSITNIAEELKKLGISDKEARVYIALLSIGETGTSKIVAISGLHRQFVYQSLEALEERGIVEHRVYKGRKKFLAKNPQTLVRLAERQRVLAESIAVNLEAVVTLPPDQELEVFQGNESYVMHEFEMLERAKEGDELLIIAGTGDRFNEEMGMSLGRYMQLQAKRKIKIRYLASEGQRDSLRKMHGEREFFEVRYLPGLFTGQVNTNIWPKALGFNIYGSPVMRFTVFSPIIAGSYTQFFETLWNIAKL